MGSKEVQALKRAVEKAGGQSALARACGVKQGHIWHWINKSLRVPAEHVLSVEAATGGSVTRQELRPDIFQNERNQPTQPTQHEAAGDAPVNAGIAEQMAFLEAKQHRAVRETLLNKSGAVDRLAKLDAAIAALRALA